MKGLDRNAQFFLSLAKSYSCASEGFKKIPERHQKTLISEGYYDVTWKMFTERAYKNQEEWFEEEYIGSKMEKLNHDN